MNVINATVVHMKMGKMANFIAYIFCYIYLKKKNKKTFLPLLVGVPSHRKVSSILGGSKLDYWEPFCPGDSSRMELTQGSEWAPPLMSPFCEAFGVK